MAGEGGMNMEDVVGSEEEEAEEMDVEEEGGGWDDLDSDGDDSEPEFKCLFCALSCSSAGDLFGHCSSVHSFDFHALRKLFALDFYSSFKLINFIRAQVAQNKCWNCGTSFHCDEDLHNHLHPILEIDKHGELPWEADIYLKPFIQDDALLHSFEEDEIEDDDCALTVDREQLLAELEVAHGLSVMSTTVNDFLGQSSCLSNGSNDVDTALESKKADKQVPRSQCYKPGNKHLVVSSRNSASGDIKIVNENYFGAYSSFGIHREMISDKVRTDSFRTAILSNPSIMSGATVMDVGCGTGILSFFAAQAGALKVFAVEASKKMAAVATQIAEENGLLLEESQVGDKKKGVVTVINSMVEELDKIVCVPSNTVDVLISEWMGYCLLYESMLGSVLYARDRWLKPGGAILPDIATMFVAGFGRGATSIPFWENVYGFDMSCIGKEVFENSSELPIVDIVDSRDIVTETAELQTLDLVIMKTEDMDFTSSVELNPKLRVFEPAEYSPPDMTWCYGIVLWFETAFSSRFCRGTPIVLSTSPYKPKTHWSQTILTFKEPIALSFMSAVSDTDGAVGSALHPASKIWSRISIARAAEHRSIDISLEITAIGGNGRKRSLPTQMFNL